MKIIRAEMRVPTSNAYKRGPYPQTDGISSQPPRSTINYSRYPRYFKSSILLYHLTNRYYDVNRNPSPEILFL
jgi:hypothetical protein